MFNWSSVPDAEPTVIPSGLYTAIPSADPSEQTSNFKDKSGNEKKYWALPLELINEKGERFSWTWCFSLKSPSFSRWLEIMGGYVLPSGKVKPPLDNAPKSFRIELIKDINKDNKLVNKVVGIFADTSTPVPA